MLFLQLLLYVYINSRHRHSLPLERFIPHPQLKFYIVQTVHFKSKQVSVGFRINVAAVCLKQVVITAPLQAEGIETRFQREKAICIHQLFSNKFSPWFCKNDAVHSGRNIVFQYTSSMLHMEPKKVGITTLWVIAF